MATTLGCPAKLAQGGEQMAGASKASSGMPADGGVKAACFFGKLDRAPAACQARADGKSSLWFRPPCAGTHPKIFFVIGIVEMCVGVEETGMAHFFQRRFSATVAGAVSVWRECREIRRVGNELRQFSTMSASRPAAASFPPKMRRRRMRCWRRFSSARVARTSMAEGRLALHLLERGEFS